MYKNKFGHCIKTKKLTRKEEQQLHQEQLDKFITSKLNSIKLEYYPAKAYSYLIEQLISEWGRA